MTSWSQEKHQRDLVFHLESLIFLLAPTPAIGDSIADIFVEMGLENSGAPGTTAALALLNDQVKRVALWLPLCRWIKWSLYSGQRGSGMIDENGGGVTLAIKGYRLRMLCWLDI